MLKVASRESEGLLRYEDVENFSCQDLGTIDKLWVKYSNGKFGFSVQKQIYQSLGGTKEFNLDDYKKFRDKVGWSKGEGWLKRKEIHYTGPGLLPWHLPYSGNYRTIEWPFSLMWRIVDCNI